jgi:hypothetical protein
MKKIILILMFYSYSFTYSIIGVGTHYCIDFLKEEDNIMKEFYLQYSYGFYAGSETDVKNYSTAKPLDKMLEKFCKENPASDFIDAINKVSKEIKKNN